jgi:20S proteasome alpha/beta subunit
VALLIAGYDSEGGAALFHTDPSGTYVKYEAKAIGSGSEGAQTALQEGFKPDMTFAEAEILALATLKQVMEEKVSGFNPRWSLPLITFLFLLLWFSALLCNTQAAHGGRNQTCPAM